jgi:predicted carbohydrate-binding protein with CBM5 and CBM33 domain
MCRILVALIVLLFTAQDARASGYAPFDAALAAQCPAKLRISAADLNDALAQDFPNTLNSRQRVRLAAANDEKRSCAHVTMGASCENTALLRAADRAHLLPRLVRMICHR